MLLDCPLYKDLREFCIKRMVETIIHAHPWIISENTIRKRKVLLLLILDPSWFRWDIGSSSKGLPNILTKTTADQLELIGRVLCFQIYKRRYATLSEEENSDTDTDVDSMYSLHDTTEDSETDESIDFDNVYL